MVSYTFGVTTLGSCGASGVTTTNTCFVTDFINHTGQTWTSISFEIKNVGGAITQDSFSTSNVNDPYFTNASDVTINDAGDAVFSFLGRMLTIQGFSPRS